MFFFFFFFFFSSRRRHTRWPRDWSSDVVLFRSLRHLSGTIASVRRHVKISTCPLLERTCPPGQVLAISERRAKFWLPSASAFVKVSVGCKPDGRSEERRVGKECRSRGSASHEKK